MYGNRKVIDVHGHMSTPPAFRGAIANWVSQNTGPSNHGDVIEALILRSPR